MPVLKKKVIKSDFAKSFVTATFNPKIGESLNASVTYVDTPTTNEFYNTIIDLLNQSNLIFTYNASEYSITIFGQKLYIFCRPDWSIPNDYISSVTPWVYYEGQLVATNCLVNRSFVQNYVNTGNYDHCHYSKQYSLIHYTLLQFQVNLYYNENFVCFTYNSATNISKELPLFTLISFRDYMAKEYLYLTNSICDDSFQPPQNLDKTGVVTVVRTHKVTIYKVLLDKENLFSTTVGSIPRTNDVNHFVTLNPRYYFPAKYDNKILLFPLTLCGGALTTDNIFIESKTNSPFVEGQYYTIDGDDYYCVSGFNNGSTVALLKL